MKKQTGDADINDNILRFDLYQIRDAYARFKVALLAEFAVLNAYFVTQKGGFDTSSLLFFGENLFPLDFNVKVPEALFDAREAGKCLAYEVPTAAGFHMFRATEATLRRYYNHVTGGNAPPKVRNISVYLNALRQSGKGDAKILAILKQMSDLYRNPVIHPEVVLSGDEAILGIARSAIAEMLVALPPARQTTETALNVSGLTPLSPALPRGENNTG